MAVQQNSLKYFGGQQSGGDSSARQVVIERTDMTAAFTEDEYQKCLSAISLGYAVAVEWTSGSSKMQAQLSIKMADGSLHFSITLVDLEMIYIRQATAVALCFFALQYIQPKKFLPFLLIVLLACTFHRVTILMLPLYFVLQAKIPTWVYITVIAVGAILMAAGIPWIKTIFLTVAGWLGDNYAQKAEVYTEEAMYATPRGITLGYVLNLLILIAVLCFKKKIDALPFGTIMLNMFALSLALYYYCYELIEVSNRVRLFFFIGIIALLPMVLEVLPLFLERLIGLIIIGLYCFCFSRVIFLEFPQAAAYNPYQNVIDYTIHPRPSSGQQRLEQSNHFFRDERQ